MYTFITYDSIYICKKETTTYSTLKLYNLFYKQILILLNFRYPFQNLHSTIFALN